MNELMEYYKKEFEELVDMYAKVLEKAAMIADNIGISRNMMYTIMSYCFINLRLKEHNEEEIN